MNVVSVAQALIAALVLGLSAARNPPANRFLVAVLLIFSALKLDQLYQFLGGLERAPRWGFVLAPLEWLMTPALYFYVVSLTRSGVKLRVRDAAHLLPALSWLLFLSITYYPLTVDQKLALLRSGALATPVRALVLPLGGAAIQCGYIVAAILQMRGYDLTLRDWFSRLENQELGWVRRILVLWLAILLVHSTLVVLRSAVGAAPELRFVVDALNLAHWVFVSVLIYRGLQSHFLASPPPAKPRYVGSQQSEDERRELFARVQRLLEGEKLFRHGDLTLGHLAEHVGATPRDLSEAINADGGQSFYDFINGFRVAETKRLLLEHPDMNVLEIAYTAGFNSKSTFNHVFKSTEGITPTQYRRQNVGS